MLNSRRRDNLIVIITPETRFPSGYDLIEGDFIVVMGERDNDTIKALKEIEAMPGEFIPFTPFPNLNHPYLDNPITSARTEVIL